MKSPSNYSFTKVPQINIPRSAFKRPRTLKTAFDAGYLVPFYWDEVYPGDTFNVLTTMFGRLSTPIAPIMDNLYLDAFYFYVPYRLLWKHWNNMLGERANPDDSIDYLTPILAQEADMENPAVTQIDAGSLLDYFGFPVGNFGGDGHKGLEINAFLCRAYNKIWNDHFRDENLQDSVYFSDGDEPDVISNFTLLRRGKRKDYFTSCLPWPQLGPGAEISIAASAGAPVFGDGNPLALYSNVWEIGQNCRAGVLSSALNASTGPATLFKRWLADPGEATSNFSDQITGSSPLCVATPDILDNSDINVGGLQSSGLYADLTDAAFTPISINDMRMAFQLQKWMEQAARTGGNRAPEIILGHFGVVCPDFRLQRAEYLGGGEVPIQIHQVVQTSSTSETSPQGNTAAYGVMSGRVGFSKSFVEHGVVIGLVACRADLTYSQGIERSWSRRSRFDYYWPELAHLGEQAVLNKEIFAQGTDDDDKAFGYQERWAELRYGISHLTGRMRVTGDTDLGKVWTVSQAFANLPKLNSSFIQDTPPLARVLAIDGEPQILFDSLTECNCVRPMPVYSVPGLIDHPC